MDLDMLLHTASSINLTIELLKPLSHVSTHHMYADAMQLL